MYPAECGQQLGKDPSKNKTFSGERTVWDSSLLVSLTLWDAPVLCTPPLPFSQFCRNGDPNALALAPISFSSSRPFSQRTCSTLGPKLLHYITLLLGHTPRGSYSRKGVLLPSRCLLESPFLEPFFPLKPTARHLLRTLLRTFSKAVSRTLLRTLLRRVRCCTPPLVCALIVLN